MSPIPVEALSPLDGRYAPKLEEVRRIFSEAGLIRQRVRVECAWLVALSAGPAQKQLDALPETARNWVGEMAAGDAAASGGLASVDVAAIKAIEQRTNHDVKAVELWIRSELAGRGAKPSSLEWVHFAATSEDINNLAYALMLRAARSQLLLPSIDRIAARLNDLAGEHAAVGMLARTHGQPATPTTMGKELGNFAHRLRRQRASLEAVSILGKMNGAVGNFNAHRSALPAVDWPTLGAAFVQSLGLVANEFTTQIEPHDWIAEYCQASMRVNSILLDFARDMWSYIAAGYFKQRIVAGQVGSSTMPHKVNPIDFENAEGNLGLANALLAHFSEKLPVSRLQRDLSDSTVLRNLGVAIGHAELAYQSLGVGLAKVELEPGRIAEDLDRAWEVLAEAVQTVMRAQGIPDAYDRLKSFTRGKLIDRAMMREFIASLELPEPERRRLLELTPGGYLGFAPELALRASLGH